MSTPSPLQPQGTLDRANAPRSRVRITVLTILALHVVFIGGLLLQGGCNKSNSPSTASTTPTNSLNTLPGLADPSTNSFYTSFPGDTAAGATNAGAPPALGAAAPANPAPIPGVGAAVPAAHPADAGALGGLAAQPNGTAGFASPNFPAATAPAATLPPTGAGTEHTIKSGDTVRDLAKKYGVSEKAILEANPTLNPRKMKVETKISIPAPTAAAPAAPASRGTTVAAEAPATGGEQYVVKPGDTLAKIAKKFGVTVKQIIAANSLKNDRIVPKQKLTIPAKASTPAAAPAASPAHSTAAPTTF